MNLTEWSKVIHQNAADHGWWDDERTFGDVIALCHSELSEALEEFRNNGAMEYKNTKTDTFYPEAAGFTELALKPEGVAVEMADCLIRILDWAGANNINMEEIVRRKHEYNITRPYRHGGKAL